MDEQQQQYLEEHYAAPEWLDRHRTAGAVENVQLTGSEIPGWTLERARRDEHAAPPFSRSLWRNADDADEIISVRITECADASTPSSRQPSSATTAPMRWATCRSG